jgi:hypothetical protein
MGGMRVNSRTEANEVINILLEAAKKVKKDRLLIEDSFRAYRLISDFVSSLDDVGVTTILAALLIVAHDLCEFERKVKIIT